MRAAPSTSALEKHLRDSDLADTPPVDIVCLSRQRHNDQPLHGSNNTCGTCESPGREARIVVNPRARGAVMG